MRVDYCWDWRREATANCTPGVTGTEREGEEEGVEEESEMKGDVQGTRDGEM